MAFGIHVQQQPRRRDIPFSPTGRAVINQAPPVPLPRLQPPIVRAMQFWEVHGRWPKGPADQREERIYDLEEQNRALVIEPKHQIILEQPGSRQTGQQEPLRPLLRSNHRARHPLQSFNLVSMRNLGVAVGAGATLWALWRSYNHNTTEEACDRDGLDTLRLALGHSDIIIKRQARKQELDLRGGGEPPRADLSSHLLFGHGYELVPLPVLVTDWIMGLVTPQTVEAVWIELLAPRVSYLGGGEEQTAGAGR
ncbi:hypothetical protein F4803DRAFT_555023 [Xylaria telfairii]|nr:hypothetical protein F4803DRAFT_555023 [Xylaria telfairii]